MSFPHLFSCPFVVQRTILNLMSPVEVTFLAMTSTKTRETLSTVSLGKKNVDIIVRGSRETIIKLRGTDGLVHAITNHHNIPKDHMDLEKCQEVGSLPMLQSTNVFESIASVFQIEHIFLNICMEKNVSFEDLTRGLGQLRRKLRIDTLLLYFPCSKEPIEPPSFLEHIEFEFILSTVRMTRIPDFMRNANSLNVLNISLRDLMSLKSEAVYVRNALTDQETMSFFNYWRTSSDMEHLKYFSIALPNSNNYESFVEQLGAIRTTATDEAGVVQDIWKLKKSNGDYLKFEKLGEAKVVVTLFSD